MTDARARTLAQHAHRIAREKATTLPAWEDLALSERDRAVAEARLWLRSSVEAGIAPLAERPSDKHSAVWLDEYGDLWAEYQTSPPTPLSDAAILPLVWASEKCSSKEEMEDRGIQFRLIGWSS